MSDEPGRSLPRPSLPPVLWLVCGVWLGTAISERAVWDGASLGTVWTVGIFSCVVALLVRRAPWLALGAVGLCVGLVAGGLFWTWLSMRSASLAESGAGRFTATATTDPSRGAYGERSVVKLGGPTDDRIEVSWPQGSAPEAGEQVEFFSTVKTGGDDEWARRRHQAGIAATAKARVVRRLGWSRSLRGTVGPWRQRGLRALASIDGAGGDLAAGVVLGDRRRLAGTQADSDFRTTGLTHLVAVSGSHLVVVAALVASVLQALRASRRLTVIATVGVIGLYVVATGVQPSAVRAWGMAAVASTAALSGRRADASAGLALAAGAALAAYPPVAFDLGFRLSVVAVAGLILFARLAESWAVEALPPFARPIAGPVSLTLTAQAATVPLTVGAFGVVSLISPLANLFAAPLVSFVLVVGLGGVLIAPVWPWAGDSLLRIACAAGALTASIAARMSQIPGAAVPLSVPGVAAAACTLVAASATWVAWPRAHKHAARLGAAVLSFALLAFAAGPPPPSGLSLTVTDVGQGDAVIVRDGGAVVLVDAGPDSTSLRESLRRHSVRRVDQLLVSHFHDDHYKGVRALSGVVPVGQIVVAAEGGQQLPAELSSLRAPVREVIAGDVLECGRIKMVVLSPSTPPDDAADNSASLVLLVRSPGTSVLLTGDAESDVLESLARAGKLPDVDVLKVGHHGSADAVSPMVLDRLRPEVALISVGQGNRYGHPDATTVGMIRDSGARVRRTDEEGDLTIPLGTSAPAESARLPARAPSGYATLDEHADRRPDGRLRGAHERQYDRPQADLSHPERARVPIAAGRGPPALPRRRSGRSRLQR